MRRLRRWVSDELSHAQPAGFAMTMATGIVSIACHVLDLHLLSRLLFWVALLSYGAIWMTTLARAVLFSKALLADFSSHQRSPGFFTSVAATAVLGTQFVVQRGAPSIGFALWCVALFLWVVCTYSVFVALTIKADKPTLADGINGGWLLAVVATQSICVLGCRVLPDRVDHRDAALFLLTSFWLCGGMLYIWLISIIFYRYTFFRFSPSDLMPPYWINMGAVAISTLAGTALVDDTGTVAFLIAVGPFVKGFTLLFWATATWWIPMLVVLGIWRHVARRAPMVYDPLYWGLVFPLGMYSVATFRMVRVFGLDLLLWIARGFVVVALVAWVLVFFGVTSKLVYLVLLAVRAETAPALAARRQRNGRFMVIAGIVITIAGVLAYCAVSFAGGTDLLLENAYRLGRATVAVLGLGALIWLAGSFTHLRGAMDADEVKAKRA